MDKSNNERRTYSDSGFNGFMRRTISSSFSDNTLSQMRRNSNEVSSLNFDTMQVSGSLGDEIKVGNITIGHGRIDGRDGDDAQVVWRVGKIKD